MAEEAKCVAFDEVSKVQGKGWATTISGYAVACGAGGSFRAPLKVSRNGGGILPQHNSGLRSDPNDLGLFNVQDPEGFHRIDLFTDSNGIARAINFYGNSTGASRIGVRELSNLKRSTRDIADQIPGEKTRGITSIHSYLASCNDGNSYLIDIDVSYTDRSDAPVCVTSSSLPIPPGPTPEPPTPEPPSPDDGGLPPAPFQSTRFKGKKADRERRFKKGKNGYRSGRRRDEEEDDEEEETTTDEDESTTDEDEEDDNDNGDDDGEGDDEEESHSDSATVGDWILRTIIAGLIVSGLVLAWRQRNAPTTTTTITRESAVSPMVPVQMQTDIEE